MTGPFDCIIVGGGLGGLTSGATLAKFGKKVLLLEQHYIPGGCATTFKRRDYVMEVGLHEIDGLHEQDTKKAIFKLLGVDKHVTFLPVPELFKYKSATVEFVHPHGFEKTANILIARYPEEEKGIRTYLDTMKGLCSEISRVPTTPWKQFLLFPIMPLLFPNIVRVGQLSVGEFLDRHIRNTELKLILTGNLAYWHDDPYSMSMFFYSVAQGSYIGGGGHFIQGGSQNLSNYLANVIEENGGQVLLGKKVTTILVDGGRVCGVSFVDSFNEQLGVTSVHTARVIANAAIPLVVDMLPQPQANKLAKKIETFRSSCSLIALYIGFDVPPRDMGCQHYSTILVGDDIQTMADFNNNCHANWMKRTLIFVDYSQLDSKLAPEGKAFGAVCAVDYLADWESLDDQAYADKKEKVSQIFISRLERQIPGIAAHVEHYELGTPRTMQSYLLTPDGAPYGFAQTPEQAGPKRIPIKSPIENLSFAGAWSFPGGGFTGAIIGGFLCGEQTYQSLKHLQGAKPQLFDDSRRVGLLQKNEIATNTIELVFEKPKNFKFEAGQYVVLELDKPKFQDIDMPIRPFSIASLPGDDILRIAMRRSKSSFKKSVDALEVGDRCRLFGPMGDFGVSIGTRGIVFLVCGIGITPIVPLLKELENQGFSKRVILFYTNRTEQAAAYHQRLQDIDMPAYEYIPVVTSIEPRINIDSLLAKLKCLEDFDYYLVGHHHFLDSMQSMLQNSGVSRSQIRMDNFG